jgi:hypothetical protein
MFQPKRSIELSCFPAAADTINRYKGIVDTIVQLFAQEPSGLISLCHPIQSDCAPVGATLSSALTGSRFRSLMAAHYRTESGALDRRSSKPCELAHCGT